MTVEQFSTSFEAETPPASITLYLKALWHDRKGDWEMAHDIAQALPDSNGSWIHAYLHRKEGDAANAGYWYHKAGKQMPAYSLEKEWEEMVHVFLKNSP